jgi:hypothetical protein
MEFIGPGRIQSLNVTIPEAKSAQERREMWVEGLTLLAKLHKIEYKKWVFTVDFYAVLMVSAVARLTYSAFKNRSPRLRKGLWILPTQHSELSVTSGG